MTKKDYILIASVLKAECETILKDYDKTTEPEMAQAYADQLEAIHNVADSLAVAFRDENPKFSGAKWSKFINASTEDK